MKAIILEKASDLMFPFFYLSLLTLSLTASVHTGKAETSDVTKGIAFAKPSVTLPPAPFATFWPWVDPTQSEKAMGSGAPAIDPALG